MEKTFFKDEGATVTNARFMTNGQTHALSGITSVAKTTDEPLRMAPIVLGLFGLAAFTVGQPAFGVVAIIMAVFWWLSQKTTHTVTIRTSAGELKALTDTNGARVGKIVEALNAAIVYRS
ncbi:hypothetical protein DESA109040_05875 [Deinococcus saxicola]|uniref:DUF6232 family protein n=1 Tax=Deinococcus saxicola TaxID=249406 RepID=UPI0039EE80D7